MHLARLFRRINELSDLGIDLEEPEPADESEIAELEEKLGFRLPAALRELHRWGGNDLGFFNGGFLVDLSSFLKRDIQAEAAELLEKLGVDPASLKDTVVVQMDYDGNFSYIPIGQGDDPPVFSRTETGRGFRVCARLSDYLLLVVEEIVGIERVELVRSLKTLGQLAEHGAESLKQLYIGGTVKCEALPELVFAFRELRALNVVSIGLMELSPRIAELACLKRLDIARNSLVTVPMALTQLGELEDLDLSENRLTTVIALLRNIPSLRFCALQGNSIPREEISQIQSQLPGIELRSS